VRLFAAAVACATLAVVAGCGGAGSSSTPATQTQAASSTPAPAAQPVALPVAPGPIPAGTYETATFRPALRFTLPAGFQLRRPEYEDLLSLVGNDGAITVLDLDTAQSIDPKVAASPNLTRDDLRPPPSDLGSWLAHHPSLTVSNEHPVRVAGMQGTEVDVRSNPDTKDISLFYAHDVLLGQPKGGRGRIVFFETGGHLVVVAMLAPAASFDAFAQTADGLVSSLALATNPPAVPAPTGGGACGQVETFPVVGREHVDKPPPASTYNSFPPTSGPHYPDPADWGTYDKPFEQFVLIHNLEHGGIVVQYGKDVPSATVDAIKEWVGEDPDGLVLAPLPQLGSTVALTAWTHLMKCSSFDAKAFGEFRDAYRYRGPELLSADSYKPSNAA
jgi:hypothetical protein